jgi:hypothetical protein
MDHAVALVQAYLQVNGYFTVAEYPVLEALELGGYKAATDVDLLGLRLPMASGGAVARPCTESASEDGAVDTGPTIPDPALRVPRGSADLLIIEVKEGRAELNRGAKNDSVLTSVLTRFGLCPQKRLARALRELQEKGKTRWTGGKGERGGWPARTSVRMLAFGSVVEPKLVRGFHAISLSHVTGFLQQYMEHHWESLRYAQIKHEALGFLALLEQVRRSPTPPSDQA